MLGCTKGTVITIELWAIWRLVQKVIRVEGKSVGFGGRGRHPKMTFDMYDLLLRACYLSVVGDAVQHGC